MPHYFNGEFISYNLVLKTNSGSQNCSALENPTLYFTTYPFGFLYTTSYLKTEGPTQMSSSIM